MTGKVNAAAAARVFLAHTEEHLVSYLEACVHCGQCADACHFYEASGDPRHTPAYKLFPHRQGLSPDRNSRSRSFAPKVTEDDLKEWEELLFDTCTMCGRCTTICPMGIDIASIVGGARQAFVAAGLGPEDLLQAADNSRDHGSPLGVTPEKLKERIEWLEDEHEVPIALDKDKADILLTVSSIETMKYPESIVAMAKLLNHAGVNWTLSSKGYEATNFGYLAGKADVAKLMVTRIVEAAEAVGAKTVVIPECGHAFGVLRWAGANMLGPSFALRGAAHLRVHGAAEARGEAEAEAAGGIDHLSRSLPDLAARRRDRRCALPAAGFRTGLPRNDADRKSQLVLRRRRRRAGDRSRRGASAQGVQDQDRPGGEDRRQDHGLLLLQLPADHGREQGALKWEGGLGSLVEIIADHLIEDSAPQKAEA